jgi:hypothetical protein
VKEAKLVHTFQWLCPECHNVNFAEHEAIKLDEAEIRDMMNLDPWDPIPLNESVHVQALPDRGKCKCGEIINLLPPDQWEPIDE